MYYINHPLSAILADVSPQDCPLKLNFHCHTVLSDGSLEPEELIAQASNLGIKHLAVTDHHHISAFNRIVNWQTHYSNFTTTIWTGIEISCLINSCLVHVIGLGFDINSNHMIPYVKDEAPSGNHLQAELVIKDIHKSGGLAVLAHPARYRLNYIDLVTKAALYGIDAIETWYDYEQNENWKYSEYICQEINKLRINLSLLSTCGTDTHGYSLKGR